MCAGLLWLAPRASGQNLFPGGEDAVGIYTDGESQFIRVVDSTNPVSSRCFEFRPPADESGKIQRTGFALLRDTDDNLQVSVFYARNDGSFHFVTQSQFTDCISHEGTLLTARVTASTSGNIPVSNHADSAAATCDGRFAVVVGVTDSTTPVSLVDLTSGEEVDTFPFDGNGLDVAACDDGQSVLVLLDNASGTASEVRRLTVSDAGALEDTGENLPLGSAAVFLSKVFSVPGSKVGLVLLTEFFTASPPISRLVSFNIPGLQMLDAVDLAGRLGNAAAVSCTGEKVFARSGNRIDPDFVEGFSLDPVTGLLGESASPTINVSYSNVTNFVNALGLSRDDTQLFVPEITPDPQISIFDAVTGTRLGTLGEGFSDVGEVRLAPCCALTASVHPRGPEHLDPPRRPHGRQRSNRRVYCHRDSAQAGHPARDRTLAHAAGGVRGVGRSGFRVASAKRMSC